MDTKKYLITSVSNVTVVNIFSMIVTAVVTLIVPRYIANIDYGLWQLFVFYQGYLGFFHFGWNDGIYLRYGGCDYRTLDKKSFFSQFYTQILFECLIAGGIIILYNGNDESRFFIVALLAINLVVLNSRYMLIYILQATARIKEYSVVLFVDRLVYIGIIIYALVSAHTGFKTFIFAETVSKTLAYFVAIMYCRDIVFHSVKSFALDVKEIWSNIHVGIKILLANISSMLVMGIVRWGVEKNWNIETFGEVSLTITLSQLFITFVTNIGLVLFPLLKKMDRDNLETVYRVLRIFLFVFLSFVLVLYFPGSFILKRWLPNYNNSIVYMGLLLPICFYESKMALINNTYLKALRKEKTLMLINVYVLILSVMATIVTTFICKNLTAAILTITVITAIRSDWAEIVVNRELGLKNNIKILQDNVIMVAFVICGYGIGNWIGGIIYFLAFLVGILVKRREICWFLKIITGKKVLFQTNGDAQEKRESDI